MPNPGDLTDRNRVELAQGEVGTPSPDRLFDRVLAWLRAHGVEPQHRRHAPARSTAHIALLRDLPVSAGVKALVVKAGSRFVVVALRADRSVDNRVVRQVLGASRLRFASAAELFSRTGARPGQVPPLGRSVFDLELYADLSVQDGDIVAFTAGTDTDSLILPTESWLRVAAPILAPFCVQAPEGSGDAGKADVEG